MFVYLEFTLRCLPVLDKEVETYLDEVTYWPKLSVIIPACNEESDIEIALTTVLAQDYPDLEIILVNDRSTDRTGDIINRLCEEDARVQIIEINELPSGWLGKVNALHQGLQKAQGDWYLFTDADVQFKDGFFKKAIKYALHHEADNVAVLPEPLASKPFLGITLRAFLMVFLTVAQAVRVNKTDSKVPFGVGGFNLVRADKFRQTPGFEWLRLEPVDDFGLGVMMKKAGANTRVALSDEVVVPWYDSIWGLFKGAEKNTFGPATGYSVSIMLLKFVLGTAMAVATPVAWIAGLTTGSWIMLAAAGIVTTTNIVLAIIHIPKGKTEALSLLFFQAGFFVVNATMPWAAYRCLKNGGIDWRGTHYSIEELRAGQRVKF